MIDTTRERADVQATYIPSVDSGCESTYEIHEGLVVVPILGSPTDEPVIGRVHSPFTVRRSQFSYAKGAAPPLIPGPGDTRTGHTFLSGSITVQAPVPSAEGTLNFRAGGVYTFILPNHLTNDGKIMFDAHPYVTGVDTLGAENPSDTLDPDFGGFYNTWKSQYFDLNVLSSGRILG